MTEPRPALRRLLPALLLATVFVMGAAAAIVISGSHIEWVCGSACQELKHIGKAGWGS